jgi:hypothetical protein
MSLKSAVLSLMGVPYEMAPIAEVPAPVRRAVIEAVDPALATEEQHITALQRREYQSFSPVLSPTDPAVQAATFRSRFEPGQVSEAERRARAERALMADAPVEARRAPLITSPELERMEKRAIRSAEQSLVPVQRKRA